MSQADIWAFLPFWVMPFAVVILASVQVAMAVLALRGGASDGRAGFLCFVATFGVLVSIGVVTR